MEILMGGIKNVASKLWIKIHNMLKLHVPCILYHQQFIALWKNVNRESAILSDIFVVALKRAVLLLPSMRVDARSVRPQLSHRLWVEHATAWLLHRRCSDWTASTPPLLQINNTLSVAAVMTSRDVTSNGWRRLSLLTSRECTSTVACTVHTYCNNLHNLEATFFIPSH